MPTFTISTSTRRGLRAIGAIGRRAAQVFTGTSACQGEARNAHLVQMRCLPQPDTRVRPSPSTTFILATGNAAESMLVLMTAASWDFRPSLHCVFVLVRFWQPVLGSVCTTRGQNTGGQQHLLKESLELSSREENIQIDSCDVQKRMLSLMRTVSLFECILTSPMFETFHITNHGTVRTFPHGMDPLKLEPLAMEGRHIQTRARTLHKGRQQQDQ